MWDALRMHGVAHEPTAALFVFNGEGTVLWTFTVNLLPTFGGGVL